MTTAGKEEHENESRGGRREGEREGGKNNIARVLLSSPPRPPPCGLLQCQTYNAGVRPVIPTLTSLQLQVHDRFSQNKNKSDEEETLGCIWEIKNSNNGWRGGGGGYDNEGALLERCVGPFTHSASQLLSTVSPLDERHHSCQPACCLVLLLFPAPTVRISAGLQH